MGGEFLEENIKRIRDAPRVFLDLLHKSEHLQRERRSRVDIHGGLIYNE